MFEALTVKFPPRYVGVGAAPNVVVDTALDTTRVGSAAMPPPPPGVVDAVWPLQTTPVPVAVILKVVVAGVIPAVVLTVKVVVTSVPALVIVFAGLVPGTGANEALAPPGNPDVLRTASHGSLLPWNETVTEYVAELPAETGLGDCAPTALILFGFASVNVVCAWETLPTAVK